MDGGRHRIVCRLFVGKRAAPPRFARVPTDLGNAGVPLHHAWVRPDRVSKLCREFLGRTLCRAGVIGVEKRGGPVGWRAGGFGGLPRCDCGRQACRSFAQNQSVGPFARGDACADDWRAALCDGVYDINPGAVLPWPFPVRDFYQCCTWRNSGDFAGSGFAAYARDCNGDLLCRNNAHRAIARAVYGGASLLCYRRSVSRDIVGIGRGSDFDGIADRGVPHTAQSRSKRC